MGSKMLADVKPEVKPEISEAPKVEVTLPTAPELRNEVAAPTQPSVLPNTNRMPEVPRKPILPLPNFGWATFGKKPAVPFIRRDSVCYVANEIYARVLLYDTFKIFSKKATECVTLKMATMTQSEADVFNEINVDHCDGSLVGNHRFKEGDRMSRLEDARKSMHFFDVCQNALYHKNAVNDLFGFLKIGGQNEVPFVWHERQQLVPLFYFDGQSDYLEARSVYITDLWQLGYLKFCCLNQNIRRDHYEKIPLKVVNFEHIKKLFPSETTFELYWPEKCNQELLAPEVLLAAMHGMQGIPTAPEVISTAYPHQNNRILYHSYVAPNVSMVPPSAQAGPQLGPNSNGIPPPNAASMVSPPSTQAGPQLIPNSNGIPPPNAASMVSPPSTQAGPQLIPNSTGIPQPNTPKRKSAKSSSNCNNSTGETRSRPGIAPMSGYRVYANKRAKRKGSVHTQGTSEITNVPYKSPQTASSPGLYLPNSPPIEDIAENSSNMHQQPSGSTSNVSAVPRNVNDFSNGPYYTGMSCSGSQRPTVLQIHPVLLEKLQAYFMAHTRMVNCRQVEFMLDDIVWNFMVEHKLISFNEQGQLRFAIRMEVHRLWTEFKKQNLGYGQHFSSRSQTVTQFQQGFSSSTSQISAQYSSSTVVQNINVTKVTNVVRPPQVHTGNCDPGAATLQYGREINNNEMPRGCIPSGHGNSTRTPYMHPAYIASRENTNRNTNNTGGYLNPAEPRIEIVEPRIEIVEHVELGWPHEEAYPIRRCSVMGKTLLGISMSPVVNEFLVNFSEFVEKCLQANDFERFRLSKFKRLFRLNSVQAFQWQKLVQKGHVQLGSFFHDIFILYSEVHYKSVSSVQV